jgi:hypothetical protein
MLIFRGVPEHCRMVPSSDDACLELLEVASQFLHVARRRCGLANLDMCAGMVQDWPGFNAVSVRGRYM